MIEPTPGVPPAGTGTSITELVWDEACAGTGATPGGAPLRVGTTPGWQPLELLALAVEADLMRAFLELAAGAGLTVLGYASAVETEPPGAEQPALRLLLRPCIIVGSAVDADAADRLLRQALEESPVCAALRGSLHLEPESIVAHAIEEG